jgi:hypothetical protein
LYRKDRGGGGSDDRNAAHRDHAVVVWNNLIFWYRPVPESKKKTDSIIQPLREYAILPILWS